MYTACWVSDGSYIIGDQEYGFRLCRLDLYKELTDRLSMQEETKLIEKIVDVINKYAVAIEE